MRDPKARYIDAMKHRLGSGQIGRREFIRSLAASGMAVPAAMSMAGQVLAKTPRRGGLFRAATAEGTAGDILDPAAFSNGFLSAIGRAVGGTLTEIDAEGRVLPDLAVGAKSAAGGARWSFRLREGVTFHDGKPFEAADAAQALSRLAPGGPAAIPLLADLTSIAAPGPLTLELTLAAPDPSLPRRMADDRLAILRPGPDGFAIGTGGYILETFEPGRRFAARRNPDYHREDRAFFDAVELVSISDPTRRQNALLTGEVQAIDRVDPRTVALLARAPEVRILETDGGPACGFGFDAGVAPFDNPNLRAALRLAVRGEEMVGRVLLGHGGPGGGADFDPARAAALYAASGHAGPVPLTIPGDAFPGARETAQLLCALAAEAGIAVEIREASRAGAGWAALPLAHRAEEPRGDEALVPMVANHLMGLRGSLAHPERVCPSMAFDGQRMFERWWFA